MYIPTFADVEAAHTRILPYIHRTPVLTSSYFNALSGAELFFKCENFQKAGAFKARGASNAVFGLTDAQARTEWCHCSPLVSRARRSQMKRRALGGRRLHRGSVGRWTFTQSNTTHTPHLARAVPPSR